MKLAISNICWNRKNDDIMYRFLREHEYAMESMPDRIFQWEESKISGRPVSPYERYEEAEDWYKIVHSYYKIDIVSMHSLLYNIHVDMFSNSTYRRYLTNIMESAVRFAMQIKCCNLCFDCIPNRLIPAGTSPDKVASTAIDFFGGIAEYAGKRGITIAIEPFPADYGVNFINTSAQAFDLARKIGLPSFKVNINTGTIIKNDEDIEKVFSDENIPLISHIHLAEPGFKPLQPRKIYEQTAQILKNKKYDKYISMEMNEYADVKMVQGAMNYFNGIFMK